MLTPSGKDEEVLDKESVYNESNDAQPEDGSVEDADLIPENNDQTEIRTPDELLKAVIEDNPIPATDETMDYESTNIDYDGEYDNSKVLTWEYDDKGNYITVGLGENISSDCIFLDLNASEAEDGNEIGYYLSCSTYTLKYSSEETGDVEFGINSQHNNFIIANILWDDVKPADFNDEKDFGVAWYYDPLASNDKNSIVTCRAVNLNNGKLLSIFEIEIGFNETTEKFELQSVYSVDVMETGEMDEETRSECIELAIEYLDGTNLMDSLEAQDIEWKEEARSYAIVNAVTRPYFSKLVSTENKTVSANKFPYCTNTYAVTMKVPILGYVTVYMAPITQLYLQTHETALVGEKMVLQVYGHDAVFPRSEYYIIAPYDFLN